MTHRTDSLHSYAWDDYTRPTTIDSVTVTYDALGRMVEQNKSGTYTEIVYAPMGNKLALMNGTSTLMQAFVPLPAGATAVYNASGLQYYRHPDWLGSSRFSSTPSRTMYNDLAFAPFGEPYAQSGSTGVTDTSFAGNNQDTVANLYDAYFREYGIQGRWPSPDPAGIAAANPANPQSWNRYAYALNNPNLFADPLGLSTNCMLDDVSVDCGLLGIVQTEGPGDAGTFMGSYSGSCWPGGSNSPEMVCGGILSPFQFVRNTGDLCGGGDCFNAAPPQSPEMPCVQAQHAAFFAAQYPAALTVSGAYGADVSLLMSVSALESGWGTSRMYHVQNNPFGATPGGDSTSGLTFGSFTSAWNSWGSQWGPLVAGVGTNVNGFLNNLVAGGYNSLNAATGGDPQWYSKVASVVPGLQAQLQNWLGGAPTCGGK